MLFSSCLCKMPQITILLHSANMVKNPVDRVYEKPTVFCGKTINNCQGVRKWGLFSAQNPICFNAQTF